MIRVLLLALICVTAALALAGCPGPEYPKCESDDHCKKDKGGKAINEHCLFGQCQQCAKDSHCAAGQKCNRGRCESSCTSDSQCGSGQMCEDASCVPQQCTDAKPCGGGLQCDKGRCVAPSSVGSKTPIAPSGPLTCERKARVQFDFNMHDLRPDAREVLDNFAKCLQQNADWRLRIEGHADERGTTDYNLQLGDNRAASVRDYLVRLGVEKARVSTISYGEEKPLVAASTEEAWSQNRRAELVVQ